MNILGISAFYHDSAACLVRDGKIIAAAQEERFTRKKHDDSYPKHAVEYCLKEGGLDITKVDHVVFYEKPILKFERILETYFAFAPRGFTSYITSLPLWLKTKLWQRDNLQQKLGYMGNILFTQHHESHAASAFFPSPFKDAAILTMDGVGEWATTTYGVGEGNTIRLMNEIRFPHSLGLLYSAFTYFLGFKVNSGEYKVMGLAAYGKPTYKDLFYKELIDVKSDGSFALNMKYFNYCTGLTMTNEAFHTLFGAPPRKSETNLTQKDMDIARSLQDVTEEIVLHMARHVKKISKKKYLCLAGGVALNCVANGRLLREKIFDDIWIQPASGDAGGAVGAALAVWYQYLGNKRDPEKKNDSMHGAYLGPGFTNEEIEDFLTGHSFPYNKLSDKDLFKTVAGYLSQGKVVGWLSGRMEFGPRALGNRSILGDPRSPTMQKEMNLKIKFRESFRPFAPAVLSEEVSSYFTTGHVSPYMLLVADVVPKRRRTMTMREQSLFGIDKLNIIRSDIPAVTHVDYSARLQTVHKETNPRFHALISEFRKVTGCAVLINTSFNVRGEPIVCSPKDAYMCFMRTNMDYLILENYVVDKRKQPKLRNDSDWRKEFELD